MEKFKLGQTVEAEESVWAWLQYFSLDAILIACLLTAWIVFKLLTLRSSKNKAKGGHHTSDHSEWGAEEAPPEAAVSQSSNDPASLMREILACNDRQRGRVLDLYHRSRGCVDWRSVETGEAEKAFFHFGLAAARLGEVSILETIMQDMKRLGIPRSADLYMNLLKMVTSKRLFHTALCLWAWMCRDSMKVVDRSSWSCLLFAAVQEKEYKMALGFFEQLRKFGTVAAADYGNACRTLMALGEPLQAAALVDEMHEVGIEPYRVTYQNVFAGCCAGGHHLDQAEKLLEHMRKMDGVCDQVIYNMLIKGYVQQNRFDDAMVLFTKMEEAGVSPSSVTFGILLDACIDGGNMDKAFAIFQQLATTGLKMNAVLFTTMIKGVTKAGRVKDAVQLYHDMIKMDIEPDRVTYSILIKALSDAKELESALMLFDEMVKKGRTPDEVVLNNLLTGCVACANLPLGEKILKDMSGYGIKPTVATISIILKLYSRCQALPQALRMLQNLEAELGVPQEHRLYAQLANTCLSVRRGKLAMDTIKAMHAQLGLPSEVEIAKFLRLCVNFRLLEEAVQIANMVLEERKLDAEHLEAIADAAVKVENMLVFKATMELARKHGIKIKVAKQVHSQVGVSQ